MEDNKIAKYANGFSITFNKETGETIITFTQNQPTFNAETKTFEASAPREVATIIVPYNLAVNMGNAIEHAAKASKTTVPESRTKQ